jgi:hypothetical protein
LSYDEWVPGPFGLDAAKGATVPGERTVLVVVHHLTAGTRLAEILPLLETDRRIQVAYTAAPSSVNPGGLAEFLHGLGGLVMPWSQAVRTEFDLAIAAGHGMLERLHAPVMTLSHGTGPSKLYARVEGAGPPAPRAVADVQRERLIVGGRVVPSAVVLPHERHLALIEQECPEVLPVTVVAGDPCLDRLAESVRRRDAYRFALGVRPGRQLVFVSSTWGPKSLFGRQPDVLFRVAAELPRNRYTVVAALHPNIWGFSSRRQITRWNSDCLRIGVRLLPPEEGWLAALIAADRLLGDNGSVSYYGAAMGVPVLLGAFPDEDVAPGSHIERLGSIAPRVDWDAPLAPQVEEAAGAYSSDVHASLREDLSSQPGRSAELLRREMYRLMRLPEPGEPARLDPVPLPCPIDCDGRRAA